MVITYRAIITPYRLPAFNPSVSLRVLLTPTERSRPWRLYLTPGLLASQLLHIAYVVFILNFVGRVILVASPADGNEPLQLIAEPWRVAVYFVLVLLSTVVLTPLEVISTRCVRVALICLFCYADAVTQTCNSAQSRLTGLRFHQSGS
jgi:hypothetical protein